MTAQASNPTNAYTVPSVSITTAQTGASNKANELGMRTMQERAYAKRGEQYLLIKSPPASGKSRALMFIALDKLNNQGLKQAIIVVPERSIGSSFADEPLSQFGFYWDWQVAPQWKERARFTNLIAEPAAEQSAVAEAVNDMLKAISASLLMEQVLAPRYEFTPKDTGPKEGFDYGDEGYKEGGRNIGVNKNTGQIHLEINGLASPKTPEAARICKEDLNEVVTSFLQDKTVLERGLFDKENTLPEELTQLHMGKIVRERYPDLSDEDQEAIRQHAIAAMNITQQAKLALAQADADGTLQGSTALIDGVRKFVNVRDLDIDLIDRINPFDAAYAVLAKAMDEKSLRQVQASIAAKNVDADRKLTH